MSRYHHTAVCVPAMKYMFVYGGFVKDKDQLKVTNEFWRFSLDHRRWKRIDVINQFCYFNIQYKQSFTKAINCRGGSDGHS